MESQWLATSKSYAKFGEEFPGNHPGTVLTVRVHPWNGKPSWEPQSMHRGLLIQKRQPVFAYLWFRRQGYQTKEQSELWSLLFSKPITISDYCFCPQFSILFIHIAPMHCMLKETLSILEGRRGQGNMKEISFPSTAYCSHWTALELHVRSCRTCCQL